MTVSSMGRIIVTRAEGMVAQRFLGGSLRIGGPFSFLTSTGLPSDSTCSKVQNMAAAILLSSKGAYGESSSSSEFGKFLYLLVPAYVCLDEEIDNRSLAERDILDYRRQVVQSSRDVIYSLKQKDRVDRTSPIEYVEDIPGPRETDQVPEKLRLLGESFTRKMAQEVLLQRQEAWRKMMLEHEEYSKREAPIPTSPELQLAYDSMWDSLKILLGVGGTYNPYLCTASVLLEMGEIVHCLYELDYRGAASEDFKNKFLLCARMVVKSGWSHYAGTAGPILMDRLEKIIEYSLAKEKQREVRLQAFRERAEQVAAEEKKSKEAFEAFWEQAQKAPSKDPWIVPISLDGDPFFESARKMGSGVTSTARSRRPAEVASVDREPGSFTQGDNDLRPNNIRDRPTSSGSRSSPTSEPSPSRSEPSKSTPSRSSSSSGNSYSGVDRISTRSRNY